MGRPFVHSVRVRYAECDRQGVVFNAYYFAYWLRTALEPYCVTPPAARP